MSAFVSQPSGANSGLSRWATISARRLQLTHDGRGSRDNLGPSFWAANNRQSGNYPGLVGSLRRRIPRHSASHTRAGQLHFINMTWQPLRTHRIPSQSETFREKEAPAAALWLGHESIETTSAYVQCKSGDEGKGPRKGPPDGYTIPRRRPLGIDLTTLTEGREKPCAATFISRSMLIHRTKPAVDAG
jgi:hypothetical protein